ncbi:hypothetical protein TNCT_521091 [Trichonephila clavata]|uniref:Uncharacterized protein n=1 Tax=Trichonephila clavata TaxID=2740835 RepID=A0A8X6HIH4_TRICU|nr:hypothetical protein TNCT_521091 [Trichonephila clavata]
MSLRRKEIKSKIVLSHERLRMRRFNCELQKDLQPSKYNDVQKEIQSRKHFHLLWVEGYFCKMYLNSYKKSKSASNYMKWEPGVESNYVQSL